MTATVDHGNEPWPVRIRGRGPQGEVLGAGMLVDERRVLTCAHVVAGASDQPHTAPAGPVDVDLIGQPGSPRVSARVVPGCWVPPTDGGGGDVALLELARPLPPGAYAPLRRMRLWDRHVVVRGFPDTLEHGLYVRARLAGPSGTRRERVQMDAATTGPQISPGFSGAAVVDDITRMVVGMVVSTYLDSDDAPPVGAGNSPGSGLSWMIPVETILHHLPVLGDLVPGTPSVDRGFLVANHLPVDPSVARRITDLFTQQLDANVLIVVTVHPGSASAAAVRQAAVRSSRELRPTAGPTVGDDRADVPPVGSIDLAVDVTGRQTEAVSQRIAEWTGAADDAAEGHATALPPRSSIIDNIDEASDPETLLSDVVMPLVDQAATRDLRVLLTFRGEAVGLRLALLARRVATLAATEAAAERAYRSVATLVAGPPRVPSRSTRLRIRLTALRAMADSADQGALAARLASTERATDRAVREAEAVRRRLVALEADWSELRGRLDGFLAMAVDHGLDEDAGLSPLYRRAYEQLTGGGCDLVAAAAAVRRYSDAVLYEVDARSGRGVS
ncbi:trypsin-like peptidase domain-containing protein [Micromonospora sp. STR1_7]|uniref:Trypsin-like peptidase domain-containing protein n=1 Tax=Micromonospora parastrephiae TaxID=2806101 RepID=A0ABS1XSD4_9ACTN|nr:serine protease [Micromonospora parastrephiae]MBM0232163.1 trypsin-like peptidase domain-containing protein [Micromonospora parastrephiae]